TLTGGPGHDSFYFNETLSSLNLNIGTITDFNPLQDHIDLAYDIFNHTAGFGLLPASEFHVGAHATTTSQRIIYNPANGYLYYDANGSSPGGQELFAVLSDHAALAALHLLPTAPDFLIT